MKLTTKGRFAVAAMLDVACSDYNKAVKLSSISERQNISNSYLEQLFIKLRKAELVKSIRGPGGGYILANEPNKISIIEIINAVEDSVNATKCNGYENCKDGLPCISHRLWNDLSLILDGFLTRTTLEDVINNEELIQNYIDSFPLLPKNKSLTKTVIRLQGKKT